MVLTANSPTTATTAAIGALSGGMLQKADLLVIDAAVAGSTNGTVDLCLQRKTGATEWTDWVRFPQVAAGAAKRFSVVINGTGSSIAEVGASTTDTPAMTLAANTAVNVMPGDTVRAVVTAGAGTNSAASQKVTVTPYTEKR